MGAQIDYRIRLGLAYTPSSYQAAIFDWIERGRNHAVVEAVAGSGKTTTIVSAANLITGDGLFLAFNKSIASLLASKLADTSMRAATVYSHGFECVRKNVRSRVKVESGKYREMVKSASNAAFERGVVAGMALGGEQRGALLDNGFPQYACERLIDLARLALVDVDNEKSFPDEILDLAYRHSLDWDPCLDQLVVHVVRECLWRGGDITNVIDFTDMVWLPHLYNWRPSTYSWVFVDECQDLSRAQLALIRRSVRPGGRLLFVGDRRQAIYGFAGADSESFQAIIDQCGATVLPLSVCYRCPTKVLELARTWCPQIEACEGAPEGVVRQLQTDDYVMEAREGDLVLSRRNAPLLGLCFSLIAEGIPAVVRGRDIAAGLKRTVLKIAKNLPWGEFLTGLAAWEGDQVRVLLARAKDPDAAQERCDIVRDQAEAIRVVLARSEATSAVALAQALEELFSDERGAVTLSSIHRAKGLEADRVAILDAEGLPGNARQPWQKEQEINLAYVAYTRAMKEILQLREED